mmetsp:Transcript_9522/g.20591  ORF Transcript_9522/g.20591 Transcript_9522/m.20591 type:complete len:92 (+) Transcript_9522:193-468(+)
MSEAGGSRGESVINASLPGLAGSMLWLAGLPTSEGDAFFLDFRNDLAPLRSFMVSLFVVDTQEVLPVIQPLRSNGVNITMSHKAEEQKARN